MRPASKTRASTPPPSPVPLIYFCIDCEAERHSPDVQIPVGWSQDGPDIRCPDCTAAIGKRSAR